MEAIFFNKPKLGISACLLGQKVRYDGGHKRNDFLVDSLGKLVEWVVVCPENEVGMGVPREPVRLIGAAAKPQLIAQRTGKNWTTTMQEFSEKRVAQLRKLRLSGFVFKKDSPTCGMERVKVFNDKAMPMRQGRGLFAATVMRELTLLPCEEEGRLSNPVLRENFIERVFAYHRWQCLNAHRKTISALVDFHTRHKFLLLAHSETHYRRLGRLVAAGKQQPIAQIYNDYGALFMQALAVRATPQKHANVLDHMLGYFSPLLTPDERQEIVGLIAELRRRVIPLLAPLTLVRHHVERYKIDYLVKQIYFDPSPRQLKLRNDV